MKFKLLFLLNLLCAFSFAKDDNQFLAPDRVKNLRDSFKPVLEVPSKFLKFRALWYEGNNRQQMSNILMKEKLKKQDLHRLIDLLNMEERRLNYKASVIADAVNGVIKKKFFKELLHLMPLEKVEQEAQAVFLNSNDLIAREKLRHKELIEKIRSFPLMRSFPASTKER